MSQSPSEKTKQQFMEAVKSLSAYETAYVFSELTPGIDWRGCSKGYMAEEWASGTSYHDSVSRLTLDQIKSSVEKKIKSRPEINALINRGREGLIVGKMKLQVGMVTSHGTVERIGVASWTTENGTYRVYDIGSPHITETEAKKFGWKG